MTRARWVLGAVPAVFLAFFFAWPVGEVLARTTSRESLAQLFDSRTFDLLWFTFWQAGLSTLLTFLLALPGAWAFSRPFRGATLLRSAFTVAFVLPTVVVAVAFDALARTGLAPWSPRGLMAILAAHAFFNYAVVARVVGSAWAQIPEVNTEASRTLGLTSLRTAWRVELRLLRPAMAAAASIVFLFSFTSFGVVLILGDLSTSTLEVEIWRRTLQLLDFDGASALALVQLTAVVAGLLTWGRFQRAVGAAAPLPRRRAHPGLCALALTPGLVLVGLPVIVLIWRSVSTQAGVGLTWFRLLGDDGSRSTAFISPVSAVANSLGFALAATTVALVVGGLAALVIARRHRSTPSRALDSALMLPLGTSAVTLGFGLLITFDTAPLDLRASIVLVPLAHALVGIPFVVRAVVPALRAVPADLQDASRTLGIRPWPTKLRIDLPLVRPALGVSAGFAAAVSLGEFGATSFLSRPENFTVPMAIFRLLGRPGATNQGRAFALAVVLMGLVTVVVLIAETADYLGSRGRGRLSSLDGRPVRE